MAAKRRAATNGARGEPGGERNALAARPGPDREPLAFEGTVDRTPDGWVIRVPVRAEDIRVEKQTFVIEEVRVARDERQETEHLSGTIHREQLRLDTTSKPRGGRPPSVKAPPP